MLAPLNPRLIMISMPSFGYDGPECNARGYGNTVEAMAGVTGLARLSRGRAALHAQQCARRSGRRADTASSRMLVALHEREKTGRGQWIELAQVEGVIPFVAGAMLEYQFTGKVPAPRGNRHPELAPHGIYPMRRRRQWIALAVRERRSMARTRARARARRPRDDPRFADAAAANPTKMRSTPSCRARCDDLGAEEASRGCAMRASMRRR